MVKDKGCMNFWLLYYTFFMVDVQHLSQVRKLYEDHFTDKFDGLPFPETDLSCNYKFTKTSDSSDWTVWIDDVNNFQGSATKVSSIGELDPETQTIVLLSDAYGAEGELGILLSEIYGTGCILHVRCVNEWGAVAMADCFSPLPPIGLHTGLPPVIEASSALYHLLSIVDLSLHGHLVELGVEPQYFGLHWLHVLFGCEFLLEDLLIIWDERFASDNRKSAAGANDDAGFSFGALNSSCGAFISTVAVSMLLHLRSLLATEIATSSLQRLLNLKDNIVNVNKLIEKAKSLQALALNTILSTFPSPIGASDRSKSTVVRGHSLSSGWISPITPLNSVPESYWEEESLAQGRRSSA